MNRKSEKTIYCIMNDKPMGMDFSVVLLVETDLAVLYIHFQNKEILQNVNL